MKRGQRGSLIGRGKEGEGGINGKGNSAWGGGDNTKWGERGGRG